MWCCYCCCFFLLEWASSTINVERRFSFKALFLLLLLRLWFDWAAKFVKLKRSLLNAVFFFRPMNVLARKCSRSASFAADGGLAVVNEPSIFDDDEFEFVGCLEINVVVWFFRPFSYNFWSNFRFFWMKYFLKWSRNKNKIKMEFNCWI